MAAITVQAGPLQARHGEVLRVVVRSRLGRHAGCRAELFADEWKRSVPLIMADLAQGEPIRMSVTVSHDGADTRIFEGYVEAVNVEPHPHGGGIIRLQAASASRRLQRHRSTTYFRNSTLADVARRLGAVLEGTAGREKQLNYVQFAESDFAFLRRVADEHGCFVRPSGDGVEVRAGFAETGTELVWRRDLVSLNVNCSITNNGFKGAHYDPAEKHDHRFHGQRSEPDWTGGAGTAVKIVRQAAERAAGGGDPNVAVLGWRTPTLADFRALLERESERALGRAVVLHGRSTNSALRPGDAVDIRDAGDRLPLPVTGRVGLVAVTHRFEGQMYSNTFTATVWGGYTNDEPPPRARARGVMPAFVTDNADPLGRGRIRIRYAWQNEEERTGWARVAAPYAGNGRGMLFIPEVGDEVLVAFEDGDPERPYVIGSLWNGRDVPSQDGNKRIVTAAGNAIELLEAGGREVVEIRTARGTCMLRMMNDADGTPMVVLHSEGDLLLEAEGRIQLSCSELTEFVRGDAYREIRGDDTTRARGDIRLKADRSVTLDAGMELTARGGLTVATHGGTFNNISGAMVHLQPPGHTVRALEVEPEFEMTSGWEAQGVPGSAPSRTTADEPTPRNP